MSAIDRDNSMIVIQNPVRPKLSKGPMMVKGGKFSNSKSSNNLPDIGGLRAS